MRGIKWVGVLYSHIIADYIKNKPEKAKESAEEILFLMQYDSLYKYKDKKPMLPYKIYIDNDKIRIRYINDLLRVKRAMGKFAGLGGGPLFSLRDYKDSLEYIELSKRYTNLTAKQIHLRVQRIIANEELDEKYFVYGKYEDKWMRKLARLDVYQIEHWIKFFCWCLLTVIAVVPILTIILILIYAIVNPEIISMIVVERIILIFISMPIITIPWLLWTRKWTKPTQYEKDMLEKEEKQKNRSQL